LHNTYTLQTLNQEKQHEFFALNSSLDLEHKPWVKAYKLKIFKSDKLKVNIACSSKS